jgi:hypothetical protein
MSSHYRPYGSTRLRLPRFTDSRHMKVAGLSALNIGCLYLQGWSLVVISVRGWVEPRTIVRSEGLSQWNIPVTLSVIEPVTFRIVAHCLNQRRHRVQSVIYTRLESDMRM